MPKREDVPGPEWTPTFKAAKLACVLLAAHDGNGSAAVAWARILRNATGDEAYEDAVRLLLVSLPSHPST